MTLEEAQRAIFVVVERVSGLAMRDGTAFIRVDYDADSDEVRFGTISAEHVKVDYDAQAR